MKIDIEKISEEYLKEQINLMRIEIESKINDTFSNYSLNDFKNMGDEEIVSIFENFGFEDASLCAERIKSYCKPGRFGFTGGDFSDLFSINSSNEKDIIDNILNRINSKVDDLRNQQEVELEELRIQLSFLEELFNYLYSDVLILDDDYSKIVSLILNFDLSEEDKFKLSLFVSKKIIEKNKKSLSNDEVSRINSFEEEIDNVMNNSSEVSELITLDEEEYLEVQDEVDEILESQNISKEKYVQYLDSAKIMFLKYRDILSESGYGSIDELDTLFQIEELNDAVSKEGLTLENFVLFIVSMISNIVKKSDSIEASFIKLRELDFVYQNYIVAKQDLCNKLNLLDNQLKMLMNIANRDFEFAEKSNCWEKISYLQNQIVSLLEEIGGFVLSQERINKINCVIEQLFVDLSKMLPAEDEIIATKVVPLKSFVLFDGFNIDKQDCLPYIVCDLDESNSNCLIDKSILNGKTSQDNDYRVQMTKLITDLLLLGNPETLDNKVGSVQDKKKNTTEPICYLTKNGDVDWDRPSGIYRIRPTTNSVSRFAEQKIVFHKNTVIFNQVISLIKKYLPNIEISENEDFSLYVNMGAAAKYSDEELYSVAMKRYGVTKNGVKSNGIGSKILSLLFEDGEYRKLPNTKIKLKDRLSESDCFILEQMISNSVSTYDELRKLSSLYDFNVIDRMRGVKQYGLQ